jgi:cell division protein FtsW
MKTATSLLFFAVLGLLALGIVTLVSASTGQPAARFLVMQPIWAAVGLITCGVAAWIDYHRLRRIWWLLLLLAIVLLSLVWAPSVGIANHGAARWIGYGGFRLQPSEFAKIALIISLAWYADRFSRHMGSFWRGLVIPTLGVGVLLFLIFKEPDVGTTLLLGTLSGLMLLIAGVRWSYVLPPVLLGSIAIAAFIAHDPVRSQRVYAWLHPEETRLDKGLQTYQSVAAFGSGGTRGVGLGEGRQKLGFVPEQHTDFIFSVIGEELGLVATLSVLTTFILILVCGVYISWNAADTFGMLLAVGITFLIALQGLVNVGVVTGALPNKGLALPFLSYGGSNLVVMLACVGFLISVGRHASAGAAIAKRANGFDELPAPRNS